MLHERTLKLFNQLNIMIESLNVKFIVTHDNVTYDYFNEYIHT